MAKLILLPLALGVVCLVSAVVMAMTVGSLDMSTHDLYFVISAKYLLIAGLLLCVPSLIMVWAGKRHRKPGIS